VCEQVAPVGVADGIEPAAVDTVRPQTVVDGDRFAGW